jgi:putative membrane protein
MNNGFVNLLVRWLVLALGVALSAKVVPGINYDSGTTLAIVVLLLSLFNAVLRPILLLFTLPFIILTLGLGIWLINALLFLLVGRLVDGFSVSGFGAALFGAAIVSVTNFIVSRLVKKAKPPEAPLAPGSTPPPRGGAPRVKPSKNEDVIDI